MALQVVGCACIATGTLALFYVGFFVGFSVSGHFQATESYSSLFIFATVGNFVAIILALLNWNTLTARNTEEAGSLRR